MDVRSRTIAILSKALMLPPERLTDGARLVEDLEVSSLDRFELVMGLEDEFGLEMSQEDQEKIQSVGDIVRYIEAHQ